jgi:hypothetical protein
MNALVFVTQIFPHTAHFPLPLTRIQPTLHRCLHLAMSGTDSHSNSSVGAASHASETNAAGTSTPGASHSQWSAYSGHLDTVTRVAQPAVVHTHLISRQVIVQQANDTPLQPGSNLRNCYWDPSTRTLTVGGPADPRATTPHICRVGPRVSQGSNPPQNPT